MLQGGTLPDIYKTVNFGSRPEEAFSKLWNIKRINHLCVLNSGMDGLIIGVKNTRQDAKDVADVLDKMLPDGCFRESFTCSMEEQILGFIRG